MKLNKINVFGARKTKSIIALVICFGFWQIVRLLFSNLDLEVTPIYACFYAVIEMRTDLETEKRTSLSRIKANLVGFMVAFAAIAARDALLSINGADKFSILIEFGLITLGVFISLNIADAINCTTLCAIATITFIVCFRHTEHNPYFYATLRFFQTLMGLGVAYMVNLYISPPKKDNNA